MDLSSRPRHAADLRVQRFEGEILLFDGGNATGILLNETASLVWLLCDGERSVSDIIEYLRGSYPLEAERLLSDVADAIDLLSGHGAIVIR